MSDALSDAALLDPATDRDSPATVLSRALARARQGEQEPARSLILDLERRYPTWHEPPFRLGDLLREAGDEPAAIAAYERALLAAPRHTETLLHCATLYLSRREPERAHPLLLRLCAVAPDNWQAWDALGMAHRGLGDLEAAEAAFSRALRLHPGSVSVAMHLSGVAVALGHGEAELARLEARSAQDPLDVVILACRAGLLAELGRVEEAAQLLEAAVAIAAALPPERGGSAVAPQAEPATGPLGSPEQAGHHAALVRLRAEFLLRSGRAAESVPGLRESLARAPDDRVLRNNLAVALTRTQKHFEALRVLDVVPADDGNFVTLCNRANALLYVGRQAEAVVTAQRATELSPHDSQSWLTLANALLYSEAASGAVLAPVLHRAAETAARIPPDPDHPMSLPPPRYRASRRMLRVGLLSDVLRNHPVGAFTVAGFENLDPAAFELVCIGQCETGDLMQRRFQAIAAEWHRPASTGWADIVAQVRGLGLDILIDLGGYGDQGRMGLCASRLAPVQIKWVGMQNHSTGLPEMDWFITDRWETPAHLQPFYTERLLVMPDGYVCYAPPVHGPAVGPLPAARTGAITFGCYNNVGKITPRVIAIWSRVLAAVPGSRFVVKSQQFVDPDIADGVRDAFAANGVAAERLDLRGASSHRRLLEEYGDIDIVLDPFPYSGGLTTCEALWMGVPVLTCPGETFASRHSASHLSNIGLTDWVVPDLDSYVTEAVRRAADQGALASLRAGLRDRMLHSPLCDGPRFGQHLDVALRRAWQETEA